MSTALAVLLLGPTASGKSALALALALEFGGEIISCDSVAVYREWRSAPPSHPSKSAPASPTTSSTSSPPTPGSPPATTPAAPVPPAAEITARGRLPIVCGGTGLYLRAMLEGLFAGPERDEDLRHRLRHRRRPASLWRLLAPPRSRIRLRIHPNDEPKLIRAIEVCARRPPP